MASNSSPMKDTSLIRLLSKILDIGLSKRRQRADDVNWIYDLDLRNWSDYDISHVTEEPTIVKGGTQQEVKIRYLFKQKNAFGGFDRVSGMNILLIRNLPVEKARFVPSVDQELSAGCEWNIVQVRYCKNPMNRAQIDLLEAKGKGHPDTIKGVVIKNN